MVLQQQPAKAQLWGWGTPGITLELNTGAASATVGPDGKWLMELSPQPAGLAFGDGNLTMSTADGKNALVLSDVLFGEVWLCTGQSNMAVSLSDVGAGPHASLPLQSWSGEVTDGRAEIANASAYPLLRLATQAMVSLPDGPTEHAKLGLSGSWFVPAPATVRGFSAVCWMFGRRLQQQLGVPVGLVQNCVGGTAVERWSSQAALGKCDQTRAGKMAQCKGGTENAGVAETKSHFSYAGAAGTASSAAALPLPAPQQHPAAMPGSQGANATLYNGMIAPWLKTAVQGAIW